VDIDFSQLYIVKPKDMVRTFAKKNNNYPNFTIPEKTTEKILESVSSPKMSDLAGVAGLAAGAAITSLPIALLIGAIASSPSWFSKVNNEKSTSAKLIDEKDKQVLEEFLFSHAITIDLAAELGLVFPPGHPQVGVLYKRHPLSAVVPAKKENVYIPHDKYDEILMAEREAELLKLLVHLGATKIAISHNNNRRNGTNMSGEISVGSKAVGEVEGSINLKNEGSNSSLDKRVFTLTGKQWDENEKLNREDFLWVSFEPSWEALIVAREVGGCTKAALDIRENTSFSSDRELMAKVEHAVYSGTASATLNKQRTEERIYFVEAEFSEIRQQQKA